jgi:RNA polymerase sigma-70 factor (ECF subfamily)
MDTESEALVKSRAGDTRAFNELIMIHQGAVRAFLRTQVRDWTLADDLAQDVFVTAFKSIKGFRMESSFASWLRGIAINHLRNFRRKRKYEPVGCALEVEKFMERQSVDFLAEPSSLDALQQCLSGIDQRARALLTERYVHGKTVRELSLETGRKHSTLSMQFIRLRELLVTCVKARLQANSSL